LTHLSGGVELERSCGFWERLAYERQSNFQNSSRLLSIPGPFRPALDTHFRQSDQKHCAVVVGQKERQKLMALAYCGVILVITFANVTPLQFGGVQLYWEYSPRATGPDGWASRNPTGKNATLK
jgi:hypothetical protein